MHAGVGATAVSSTTGQYVAYITSVIIIGACNISPKIDEKDIA